MSGGWYRSSGTGSHIVHEGRCHRRGNSRRWVLVEGMPSHEVLAKLADVPWLRLCSLCADRMKLDADDPARFSDNDAQPA